MSVISKALYKVMLEAGAFAEKNFKRDTKDAGRINRSILMDILSRNKNCEIGKKYSFKEIKSEREYKEKVPVTEYDFYEGYIERMTHGEKNVLVKDKVEYFSHTSGTTGNQKLIPSTRKSRHTASKYMMLLINRFAYNKFKEQWNYGKGLILADMVMTSYTDSGIPVCAATSGGVRGIKAMIPYMYTSPIEVMEMHDKETALYLHLLFALKEKKLMFISCAFIPNVLDMFRMLEKNYKSLIYDVTRGTINRKLNIDEKVKKRLKEYLSPDAARGDFLKNEFEKGFEGIAERIWPNLVYVGSVSGADFAIYDDKMNYYLGNIPIYSPMYAASEASIGINPYVEKIEYVVIPDTVYYEFIPSEHAEERNPKTYGIDELVAGKENEVVVTNYAGLYRYRIHDVVKVEGFFNGSPSVKFLYRRNQVLNMNSEKTNMEQLTDAVKNGAQKEKLELVDYSTAPDTTVSPGRYIIYIELKNPKASSLNFSLDKVFDEELKKSNPAYARARKNNKLGCLKVNILKEGTFSKIKDVMAGKSVSKSQIKIPRMAFNKKEIMMILDNNIIR